MLHYIQIHAMADEKVLQLMTAEMLEEHMEIEEREVKFK